MTTQPVYAALKFSDGTTGLFEQTVTDDVAASEVKSMMQALRLIFL